MTTVALTCPSCSGPVSAGDRYCEACGAELACEAPSGPASAASPVLTTAPRAGCRECGGEVAQDGYCTQCGARAVSARDHFSEEPAPWVAGVCDRGIRHQRNEDALALDAEPEPGSRAVMVVCDGVSSSQDCDVASLAAARTARDVLAGSTPRGAGTVAGQVAATVGVLEEAVTAANEAVIATTPAGAPNPPACTFVGAVLDESLLVVGWVGDSRAYWVPDEGEPRLLTIDDSYAAEQVALGVPRAEAEAGPQAHAITRWLGIDAPDHVPRTTSVEVLGPGWVLVCSDGLWNYCSEPGDVASLVHDTVWASTGAGPLELASALVDWANHQGGRDNITVALARAPAAPPPREERAAVEGTAAGALDPTTALPTLEPRQAAYREEGPPDGDVLS